jgi:DNA-binding NarL/FixJ family response regulator
LIRVYIDAGSAITRSGLESLLAADRAIEIVHDSADADVVVGDTGIATVFLTDDEPPEEAFRAGARAVLPRDASPEQIVAAVHAVAAGLLVMTAEEGPVFLPHAPVKELVEALTAREMDVLEMLAEGLSNKMIAHRLSISDHTAKFHVNSILAKLDAGTRTEAVTRGIRLGLIKL